MHIPLFCWTVPSSQFLSHPHTFVFHLHLPMYNYGLLRYSFFYRPILQCFQKNYSSHWFECHLEKNKFKYYCVCILLQLLYSILRKFSVSICCAILILGAIYLFIIIDFEYQSFNNCTLGTICTILSIHVSWLLN